MSKEFTIEIDNQGNVKMALREYEAESPEIAKAFQEVLGTVKTVNWKPGNHAHLHAGHGHKH